MQDPDQWIQSCCVLCTNGCGLDIGIKDGRRYGDFGLLRQLHDLFLLASEIFVTDLVLVDAAQEL
jgi:hypothetical protein